MLRMNRLKEKQLNFEKPLLSVRRFTFRAALENDSKGRIVKSPSTAPRPPKYQSELKSGPVRNPGTVPFSWEQNPGRPKDGIEHKSCLVDNRPPTVPNLPPGRSSKFNQPNLERNVPKNNAGIMRSFDDESKQSGRSKDEKEDARSTSSLDEEDVECVDARGTLSRTESFFINCSISGLSVLEDSDTRVSETSLMDIQTRDLMMSRFLPAAMAMTSESPQHPKMLVSDEKQPRHRHWTNFVPECSRYHENEDGYSDADSEEHESFPGKVCGILPCLGLTSSMCPVSPLRGMSARTYAPGSPFRKPRPMLEVEDIPADGYGVSVDRNFEEATDPNGNGSELKKAVRQSFEELLAEENRANELNAGSPVAEKTVRVVSEHKVEPPISKSNDSDIEEQLKGKKHQSFMEKTNQNSTLESRLFSPERDCYRGYRTSQQEFIHPRAPSAPEKFKNDSELPLPPPSPKTPSDSWLGRTLPSMSLKKASSVHPHLMSGTSPKHQVLKPKSCNPKWQTIVKMTEVQDQHFRYSQDRLTPIPEA